MFLPFSLEYICSTDVLACLLCYSWHRHGGFFAFISQKNKPPLLQTGARHGIFSKSITHLLCPIQWSKIRTTQLNVNNLFHEVVHFRAELVKCKWTEPKARTGLPFWHSHQGNDAVNTHTWFTCMVSWLPTVMPICSDGIMPTQVAQGNTCRAVIGLGKYFSNWVGVDLLLGRPKRKRKQKEFSFFILMDCFHLTFSKNTVIYKTCGRWFC